MSLDEYNYYIVKQRYKNSSLAFVWTDDSLIQPYQNGAKSSLKDVGDLQIIPIKESEKDLYHNAFSGIGYQLDKKYHVYGDYYRYIYNVQLTPFLLCDKKISKRTAFILAISFIQI